MSSGASSNELQNKFKERNAGKIGVFEFENFRLDAAHLMLYQNGQVVSLTPKVAETLVALVERRGEIISKDELMERLWGETVVDESNLSQNLYILRKTLGNRADGQPLIETFRRRGYRFNGELKTQTEVLIATHTRIQTVIEETSVESRIRSRSLVKGGVFVACGLLLASGFAYFKFRDKPAVGTPALGSLQGAAIKRLMPDVYASSPTLSPNGEYLAFINREKDRSSIWLKAMSGGNAVQTMPPNDEAYEALRFSPDGKQLYYMTLRHDSPNGTISRIPVFGGTPQDIAKDATSPFAVSPDGKQLAFLRGSALVIVSTEEKGERQLSKLLEGELFVTWGSQPSWSPDGNRVAVCATRNEQGRTHPELLEISVSDSSRRIVPIPDWNEIDDVAWLADGQTLLVTAREKAGDSFQIWHVQYPDGKTSRVTNDSNNYEGLSLTADSRTLVAEQNYSRQNIWMSYPSETNNAKRLTSSTVAADGYSGLAFGPDGKIIYASPRSGNVDLWAINEDGSGQQQVTSNAGNYNGSPRLTSDGRYLVFVSSRTGTNHIWRMDADGRNAVQLTKALTEEGAPRISSDGKWVYYVVATEKPSTLWKVPIEGGTPVRVSGQTTTWSGTPSPDGNLLACYVFLDGSEQPWKIGVMSAQGGEPFMLLDIPAFRGIVSWTADSKSLIYIKGITGELWQQPIDGRASTKLFDIVNERLYNFAFSPDLKKVAYSLGNEFREAVLISNFVKD